MHKCRNRRCFAPDVACALGEDTPADCKEWLSGTGTEGEAGKPQAEDRNSSLPWAGTAMGTRDLAFLAARGEAKLIAILGAHNAGKTTLLAAWYQHLGRSGKIGSQAFAGSFSLTGWEAVAHALRWEGGSPKFPPHTSSGGRRTPGMLHLALRDDNDELADYLFADSPGEWFQRWAVERDAPDAEGARWLVERAAALIVIADCEALSGPQRGSARSDMIQLIRRTAQERGKRPVALVWTKADLTVSDAIRGAVRDQAFRSMPDIAEYAVSIKDFEFDGKQQTAKLAIEAVLGWTIAPMERGFSLPIPPIQTDDPFFRIGSGA